MAIRRIRLHPWSWVVTVAFGTLGLACGPGTAVAQNAPNLRYGFQAGQQHGYQVRIFAQLEHYDEVCEGLVVWTVLSATDQQVVLKQSGSLPTRVEPHPGVRVRPGPPRLHGFPTIGGPQGITINRQGGIVVSRKLTSLPFLLGNIETLILEEFPAEAKPAWQKQRDVVIEEVASRGPGPRGRGPFAPAATDRPANEVINFTVAEVKPGAVRITRQYQLRSANEAGKPTRFNMTGSGDFTFHLTAGLIESASMKYDIEVAEGNVTIKLPITVSYQHLTAEELADRLKRQEEERAKAVAEAKKAAEPKPFEPGERERLLKDVGSTEEGKLMAAADRLVKAPADEQAAQFAVPLAKLLTHSNDWVKGAAAKALAIWATPEVEGELAAASKSENPWVRAAAIAGLGKIATEGAAVAVAAQMSRNLGEASKSLKAIRPAAETATIGWLKDSNGWIRKETCLVLTEIGGKKSVAALKEYAEQATGADKADATRAIDAIEARLAKAPEPASPAKPASGTPRKWRDASGTYEVEAVLVGVADGKATLQRTNGKSVSVPLDKLCDEDQAYVRSQKSPEKPPDPFQ